MNKVHPKLTFLLFFLLNLDIYGQNLFKPGYIITNQKDTQTVFIDFESSSKCITRKDKIVTEYMPNEILGFGFVDNRYYSSEIVRDTFVEVLITGPISLYRFEKIFYIQKKDQELVKLEKKPNRRVFTGYQMETKEDNNWRGILRFMCSDCPGIKNDYDDLNLNEKNVSRKIIQYNKCAKKEFTVYKSQLPFMKIAPGIGMGITYSQLTLNRTDRIPDIPTYFTTWQTTPIVIAEISSPKVFSALAFQVEFQYNKFKSRSETIIIRSDESTYYETLYNLDILSATTLLKYKLPLKQLKLSLIAGLQNDFIFHQPNRLIIENFKDQKIFTEHTSAFKFNKSSLGYLVGIGTEITIGGFSISSHLRINPQREKITAFLSGRSFTSYSKLDRALIYFSISRR